MANTGGVKNIVLFLNNDIGLKVFRYLLNDDKVKIIQVYLVNNLG
jgi:hypothetical protein